MTEKVSNKRTLFATYFNTGLLIFLVGVMMKIYVTSTHNTYTSFKTVEELQKVINHVDNTTFSEVEAHNLVNHVKDTVRHTSLKERLEVEAGRKRSDSLMQLLITTQWSQVVLTRRLEAAINEELNKNRY